MNRYKVEPYEIDRYLVVKDDDTVYVVELNYFGKDSHGCSCDHYSKRSWKAPQAPCRHIRLVLESL